MTRTMMLEGYQATLRFALSVFDTMASKRIVVSGTVFRAAFGYLYSRCCRLGESLRQGAKHGSGSALLGSTTTGGEFTSTRL